MHQSHLIKSPVAFALIAFCTLVSGPAFAQTSSTTAVDADARADSDRSQRFDYHSVHGRQPIATRVGRYEGETDFELVGKSRVQGLKQYGDQWNGDSHLLWDGAIGESMETSFDVQTECVYDLAIQLTVAVDYGLFELSIPGTDVRRTVDLDGPNVALAPPMKLKDVRLNGGKQLLSFNPIGSNRSARKFQGGYSLGLDYIQLTRKDKPPAGTDSPDTAIEQSADTTTTIESASAAPLAFDALKSMMNQFCFKCHGGGTTEADVDLTAYTRRETLLANIDATREIRDAVARHEMPPDDEKQPTRDQRTQMVAAFNALIDDCLQEHRSSAAVVMRRPNRYECKKRRPRSPAIVWR
ncbi:MAG: hypothetical protein O3C40_17095 [Planctomycetota bacterium]|nr:hypothetical protein [Planctomycetota bacterium]